MDLEVGHDPFSLTVTVEEMLDNNCPIACDNHDIPCDYYHATPLDFVSRDEWAGSLHWRYYVNILRYLALLKWFSLHYDRPCQRIDTFNWPKLPSKRAMALLGFIALCYSGWFLGTWNFYFPTETERNIWRSAVVIQASLCLITTIVNLIWEEPHKRAPNPTHCIHAQHALKAVQAPVTVSTSHADTEKGHGLAGNLKFGVRKLWSRPCGNETGHFPSLSIPLGPLSIMTPVCAIYCICRWIILTEDVVALRALPASAYEEVNWAPYWPWF